MIAISVVPGPTTPEVVEAPLDSSAAGPGVVESADGFAGEVAVIADDDPVAALRELVARRERCFRELSVLCLEGVDEPGSAALDADRAALSAILDGGDPPTRIALASPALVERLGDSALVDLGADSDPASVLLLKGEAGWRIRDYLAASGSGEVE